MAVTLARQKLARYASDEIMAGRRDQVIDQLAAYLVESNRTDEFEHVVRTVQELLESDGHVYATATTATALTAAQREQIKQLLDATDIEIEQTIDKEVIGGIRLRTPSRLLDATIARRLGTLRESKV